MTQLLNGRGWMVNSGSSLIAVAFVPCDFLVFLAAPACNAGTRQMAKPARPAAIPARRRALVGVGCRSRSRARRLDPLGLWPRPGKDGPISRSIRRRSAWAKPSKGTHRRKRRRATAALTSRTASRQTTHGAGLDATPTLLSPGQQDVTKFNGGSGKIHRKRGGPNYWPRLATVGAAKPLIPCLPPAYGTGIGIGMGMGKFRTRSLKTAAACT
ncbi:hypothetical protein GGTG_09989 [Gaeumannomyces tritici R3-111a-1]|uniref:Uncharacterized protein n=1 Tax=Gaeumannomyces tritici (strain R3-111a-1) TaxID=644352 RepID=J3P905_GAET3|nr:hypothetical protein GGTG_09989 [Gaeumannomyces tritici R3-111a-1]EJT73140.1 hypothetical protein GGTG_09989 [Gaeumannomyces tritici R3-111a-1]